jgi:hypothetical protein
MPQKIERIILTIALSMFMFDENAVWTRALEEIAKINPHYVKDLAFKFGSFVCTAFQGKKSVPCQPGT